MSKILDFVSNLVHSDERMSQKREVRKMRKFLGILLVFGLMTSAAYAANPDNCQLLVTPGVSYSLTISSMVAGTARQFGTVNLNDSFAVAVGSVCNVGNTTCDFEFRASNAVEDAAPVVNWTINAAAVGANQYRLAVADGTFGIAATTGTYVYLDGTDRNVDATINGDALAVGTTLCIYAKIETPSSMTGAVDEFSITLSAYAAVQD